VRIAWVYPGTYLPLMLSPATRRREGWRNPRGVFLVGWAGIRGSVTLAAALSVPYVTAGGAPFPARDLIVFLAASTIVLTLGLNGLSLPLVIRVLGLRRDGAASQEERAARLALAQAAMGRLRQRLPGLARPEEIAFARRLIADYEARMTRHSANGSRREVLDGVAATERNLRQSALAAERAELHGLRDSQVINEDTLRTLEAEIDHAEALVAGPASAP